MEKKYRRKKENDYPRPSNLMRNVSNHHEE
jgi:hypothetical protein